MGYLIAFQLLLFLPEKTQAEVGPLIGEGHIQLDLLSFVVMKVKLGFPGPHSPAEPFL